MTNKLIYKHLYKALVVTLLTLPFINALNTSNAYVPEPPQSAVKVSGEWFFINYSTGIVRYESPHYNITTASSQWSFWSLETDARIGIGLKGINDSTVGAFIYPAPIVASALSEAATLCVNGTQGFAPPKGWVEVPRTGSIPHSSWCGGERIFTRQLPYNQLINIDFGVHPRVFEFWIGEGQGGGGDGLGSCESMESTLINTSSTDGAVVLTVNVNGSYYYVGGVGGCTPQTLFFEYWNTTLSAWRQIPQNNNSEPVDCNGQRCFNSTSTNSTAFRTFAQKVRCDWTGQVNISARLRYLKLGSPYDVQSPPVLLYCGINPPSPPVDEDDDEWVVLMLGAVMLVGWWATKPKMAEGEDHGKK